MSPYHGDARDADQQPAQAGPAHATRGRLIEHDFARTTRRPRS
jgi:hypothetical protein